MMNHEFVVEAIYEAQEVLEDIKMGASVALASEKALELTTLAMELHGDDKNMICAAVNALDVVTSHLNPSEEKKALAQATKTVNCLFEQVTQIAVEQWLLQSEDEAENEFGKSEEDFYDSIIDEDELDNFGFDDEEDENCDLEDVECEYNSALEVMEEKFESLKADLFEYKYGARKNDDDSYEQICRIKADIRYVQKKQSKIEELFDMCKNGKVNAWWAQDRIFREVGMLD